MSARYSSVCFTMCGRGPTMLISPSRTLMNCGSSSMLVLRMMFPHLVFRGSFSVACLVSASAFTFIERNFRHVNSLPYSPLRFCLKNTGPGMVIFVMTKTMMNIHQKKNRRKKSENRMSNIRLVTMATGLRSGS